MIKGEQTYLSNPAARQRDEFAIKNEKLRARIAELETALKDLREAVCDIDDREMFLNERRRWESCLAKADEVLKGEK